MHKHIFNKQHLLLRQLFAVKAADRGNSSLNIRPMRQEPQTAVIILLLSRMTVTNSLAVCLELTSLDVNRAMTVQGGK